MSREVPISMLVGKCETWNPRVDSNGDFLYIDLSSVDKDSKAITSSEQVACSEAPSRARQIVQEGDVLVATVRPNLNGVALVDGCHHGATASTGYCVLRPDEKKLDARYLFHWVKTDGFVQRMISVATGANYPAVSDAKVKASTIPLPPLAEQKRIARMLDAADALRAKRRETLAQLDTLIQATFLDMFGDPVTNPKGWASKPLGELATFFNGDRGSNYPSKSDFVEVGIPFINAGHLRDGDVDFLSMNYISPERFRMLGGGKTQPGDLLYCLRGSLGKSALLRYSEDAAIASSLVILRSRQSCYAEYLFAILDGHYGQREVKRFDTGSSQPNLSAASVKKYEIPLPPVELQAQFVSAFNLVLSLRNVYMRHAQELDTLFASLQARAFNGEL